MRSKVMCSKRSLVHAAFAAVALIVTAAAGQRSASPHAQSLAKIDARPTAAAGLGRGVNFGNMLEAPFEGAWGLSVEERFFDAVVQSGMDHIRLPVSWTTHAGQSAPFTIDPAFMDRVDWCVDQALSRGLMIIVNVHHYDELNADPVAESPRALAIWEQIATRMQGRPSSVYFEVLNEPHGAFIGDPTLWDAYLAQSLAVIRQTNPSRWVLAGPARWNAIGALGTFNPPADPRLMLTVHYYEPFAFTHQGASWVDNPPPVGTPWTGDLYSFASPWQNWSWGTGFTPTGDGFTVEYQQGWAGVYFHRESLLEDARRVVFSVDRAMSLGVVVGEDAEYESFAVQTADGPGEYTVELPAGFPPINRVTIQNATGDPQPAFTLSAVCVETAGGSEPLIANERDAVDAAVRTAAGWARARGMPVYLGEFGAYSTADMDSRARWTRAVRESAERHGVGWGYWELAAGFGFFDPEAGTFREPLLDALTD